MIVPYPFFANLVDAVAVVTASELRSEFGLVAGSDLSVIGSKASDFRGRVSAGRSDGFVDSLKGKRPMTCLILSHAAMAKSPETIIARQFRPEPVDTPTVILTEPLVPCGVLSGDITTMMVNSMSGREVNVEGVTVTVHEAGLRKSSNRGTRGVDTELFPR